ncbi:DUF4126 domain-containing protein [Synechococcus sp. Nb3U1]|uniref:DUF4126 domain-containing protein n=1 Tax=Synechococcus sp. Nb3U1 TaxID=1914529 RepID=UPI001F2D9575|nr:DUF4126 domain-containing protein [Synechococcus sp. Nb3U1]MCF2969607.1 DUF4126 domain-containing protein [Synechococcus sp. Nb3U1]
MEPLLAIALGLGLSAACGFRIFVPLLVMSMAAQSGHLTLAPNLQWIGSEVALMVFAVATFFEVSAYYVPWVDNLLDVMATPVAVIAGILVMSAALGDIGEVSPALRWTLAAILGGGAAGITQGTTDVLRLVSTTTTGGLGNPLLATTENVTSLVLAAVAVLAPWLAVLLMGLVVYWLGKRAVKLFFVKKSRDPVQPAPLLPRSEWGSL